MGRRSTPCTQADMTRLLKAVLAAGVDPERIVGLELTKDGAKVLFGSPKQVQTTGPGNEWDVVLK